MLTAKDTLKRAAAGREQAGVLNKTFSRKIMPIQLLVEQMTRRPWQFIKIVGKWTAGVFNDCAVLTKNSP
jgi:hypothetical protein